MKITITKFITLVVEDPRQLPCFPGLIGPDSQLSLESFTCVEVNDSKPSRESGPSIGYTNFEYNIVNNM